MIDYVSAIHQRISRRSYLPAPIEEEKLHLLLLDDAIPAGAKMC